MPRLDTLEEHALYLIGRRLVYALEVIIFGRSEHFIHSDRLVLLALE